MQLSELREYASRRGWAIANEYVDRGISGAKESRPALNRLMADAHRRKFDAVLVWKLDRFARSLKQLVNALAEMEALGVAFVSLRDNLDLSTPSGRLMFQIIGAMAEFERALIQERVRAWLRHARARGKRLGRPGVSVEAKLVSELRAHGASLRTIARQLGVGLGTIHRVLAGRSKTVSKGIVGGDATFAQQGAVEVAGSHVAVGVAHCAGEGDKLPRWISHLRSPSRLLRSSTLQEIGKTGPCKAHDLG
jgi:DNA invertase Pin-like site-specific DNA recombinase